MGLFYCSVNARSKASWIVCINHTPPVERRPFKNVIRYTLLIPIEPIGVKCPYPNEYMINDTAKPIQVPKHIKHVKSLCRL